MHSLIFATSAALFVAAAMPAVAQIPAVTPKPALPQDDASENGWTLSTGLDYSSGKYGLAQGTDILVGLSDITFKTGAFQFSAGLPYLNITGPAYVVVGAGGVPTLVNPARGANSTVRSGWGDLNLSGTYSVDPDLLDGFSADLTARVKVATADVSKGLSSGESDFGFSVDVSRQIDIWSPFVTFGYRVPGNPKTYSLNSSPSFSVGSSVQLGERFLAIVSYDFDGSISSSLADAQQLFASGSWIINDNVSLTAYAELGLSSGAPREGTGLLLSWKLP